MINELNGLSTSDRVSANVCHAPCASGGAEASKRYGVDIGKGGRSNGAASIGESGSSGDSGRNDTITVGSKGRREGINGGGIRVNRRDGLTARDSVSAIISGSELTAERGAAS